ncbi:MAG: TylF/MycF/NovP-related O-methyltransferase [bacterium]|nr:TylF/MycF/NovP-related O-methyltransferase [bacterium]
MSILKSIYRFFISPRIKYSFFLEAPRRWLLTYDHRETIMKYVMEYAYYQSTRPGKQLHGDYFEFGTYRGNSFIKAWYFAKWAGLKGMKFFAFDSFGGYPPLTEKDKNEYYEEGQYNCDLPTFKKILRKAGVKLDRVCFCQMFFEDLKEKAYTQFSTDRPASVVWIDCDLYKATKLALDWVDQYLVDGTIVVLADWFLTNGREDMGQPLALKEFHETHETRLVEMMSFPGAKMFIVSQR